MEVNTEELVRGVSYDPEPEKTYLILLEGIEPVYGYDDVAKPFRDWQMKEGRQAAYDYIKDMVQSEYVIINVHKSRIIVSSVKITDGISIYKFMKSMKENDKVIDYTSFDIEDYVSEDEEGE